jgi:hypothetical protein
MTENISSATPQSVSDSQSPGCLLPISAVLGIYQIIFAFRVLHLSDIFTSSAVIPPAVHAMLSAVWGVALLWGALQVAQRKRSALPYTGWLIIAFVMYSLLRSILFAQTDYDQGRIPFLILITLAALIIPVLSLLSRDKSV